MVVSQYRTSAPHPSLEPLAPSAARYRAPGGAREGAASRKLRLALTQNCRPDNGAGSALLEEGGAPIGTWPHEAVALQLDGHWVAVPHADRHQVTYHIVIGDGLALVFPARNGHRHMRSDDRQPQGSFLALRTGLPRPRLHHQPLFALR